MRPCGGKRPQLHLPPRPPLPLRRALPLRSCIGWSVRPAGRWMRPRAGSWSRASAVASPGSRCMTGRRRPPRPDPSAPAPTRSAITSCSMPGSSRPARLEDAAFWPTKLTHTAQQSETHARRDIVRRKSFDLAGSDVKSCQDKVANDVAVCSDKANTACSAGGAMSGVVGGLLVGAAGGASSADRSVPSPAASSAPSSGVSAGRSRMGNAWKRRTPSAATGARRPRSPAERSSPQRSRPRPPPAPRRSTSTICRTHRSTSTT